jgi:arsenate reductase-like glutaredoxin family protein
MKFYWKSTCSSCRDARKVLNTKGIEADQHDTKKGITAATVEDIVSAAGGVAAVLNTRHEIAKANGWGEKPPTAKVFAAAVVKEVNLLRRPILIDGKKIIIGFDKDAYAKLSSR